MHQKDTTRIVSYINLNQGYSVAYQVNENRRMNQYPAMMCNKCKGTGKQASNRMNAVSRMIKCTECNGKGMIRINNKHKGILSKKGMVKIKSCIQWLMTISEVKEVYSIKEKKSFKFKLAFITLTLSDKQQHSDEFIKRHMLQPFLKYIARSYNCLSYVWKAEAQNNGNIHFHITVNKFIHWRAIRKKWNSLQQQHGYTAKHEMIKGIDQINSTDIHSVKNDKNIIAYMMKYMAKNEAEKRSITGRIWDCSTNLKNSSIVMSMFDEGYNELGKILLDDNNTEKKKKDFAMIYTHKRKLYKILPDTIQEIINNKIKSAKENDNGQMKFITESFK